MTLQQELYVKNTFLNYKNEKQLYILNSELRKIKSDSNLLNNNNFLTYENNSINDELIINNELIIKDENNSINDELIINNELIIKDENNSINDELIIINNNIKDKKKKLKKKKIVIQKPEDITDLDYLDTLTIEPPDKGLIPIDKNNKICFYNNYISTRCEYIITTKIFMMLNNKILEFKNIIINNTQILYKTKYREFKLIKKLIVEHINTSYSIFISNIIMKINTDIFININDIIFNNFYILNIKDIFILKYKNFLPLELPIQINYIIDIDNFEYQ